MEQSKRGSHGPIDVLGKNPMTTVVAIDEADTDNWGVAGETVAARRKAGK